MEVPMRPKVHAVYPARCLPLAAALLAILGLASCAGTPDTASEAAPAALPAVAILDFEVNSPLPGYEALAKDAPATIAEAFLRGGALRPIERAALARILAEQELALSGLADPAAAARVGRLAGARYILLGAVSIVGEEARISCRLVDTETAEIVWAGSETGGLDELLDVEEALAELAEEALR
jgi:TolB-like protein